MTVSGDRRRTDRLAKGGARLCEGPYGYFDRDRREYVIVRPDTPTPWINYLGSDSYCALLSNTGGGYSFHQDPRDRRLLRFRYNSVPMDRPGRYVYVRDEVSGQYWSLTWQPVCPLRVVIIQNVPDVLRAPQGLEITVVDEAHEGGQSRRDICQ